MNLWLLSTLILTTNGLPSIEMEGYQYYSEQEYQYDYDDDTLVNDVDDAHIPSHRPTILSDSIVLDVDNGMTIRLPCSVDKLPDGIQILWTKDDSAATIIAMGSRVIAPEYKDRATVMMDEHGSTLTIGIAKAEDRGLYKCSVAVRGDQPEVKHQVRIRAPPSIDSSGPSLLEVKKGDTAQLECLASGEPPPSLTWTRLGKRLPDGRHNITGQSLVFSDVTREHAGLYQCTASNGHGTEASRVVEVEVVYPPEIQVTEVFVSTYTGQDKVELVCNVHAHPTPLVVWTRGGELISQGGEGRLRTNTLGRRRHSLVITRVQQSDFGQYTCSAANSLGTTNKTIQLSGHAAPAEFKSSAEGRSEREFLLEWTSLSYTPITQFKLEVAQESSSRWKSYPVTTVIKEGAYHWTGKMFLSKLSAATQYRARVSSLNDLGWSEPSHQWNFATLGAVPSPSSVTRSSGVTSLSFSSTFLWFFLSVIILTRN